MQAELLQGDWHYPTEIAAGAGRSAELADTCIAVGMRAPLLVTDPVLAALPMVDEALTRCRDAQLHIGLFAGISGNPRGEEISAGVDAYRAGQHDGVIALGGGSALDAGKAVALMAGQTGTLWDYEDLGDNWQRVNGAAIAPIVAVPTTAGTGSEVGRAAVITDPARQHKAIIFHPAMLPRRVILDPELTTGLPAAVTAATGMDALAHNLEAYFAPGYHPQADAIAMEGARLVHDYLPRAVSRGDDIEARMQMLSASSLGATAFQKGLGAMHALAHPLGAVYDAHHGLLNAILMPYVLERNRAAIATRAARLAAYLGLDAVTIDGLLSWVLTLRRQIGIPHCLADIGIGEEQASRIGVMAVGDAAAAGNPVRLDAAAYTSLLLAAINGKLGA